MMNFPSMQLLHRHSDGSASQMAEHGPDDHDSERMMLKGIRRGAKIYRCETCADEVIVQPMSDGDEGRSS